MTALDVQLSPEQLLTDGAPLLPVLLDLLESEHERSQQRHPGHSSALDCRRAAAFGYHGTAPDPDWHKAPNIAAWVGTAFHTAALPILRRILHPARIELATTWRPWLDLAGGELPPIVGHVDLYRRRSQLALDLKTVSRHQLDYVRREGPRSGDLAQLHANAASLTAEGRPCTRVALLYVCTETSADRQDGDGLLWVGDVDPAITHAVVAWWAQVTDSERPEDLPADERGPGLSWKCDRCPWLRQCWGDDARPGVVGAQAVDPVESDVVVSALALLDGAQQAKTEASRAVRAADSDADFAAAMLAGIPEGTYRSSTGTAYDLTWSRGQLRVDAGAVEQLLRETGYIGDLPRKRTASKPKAKAVQP